MFRFIRIGRPILLFLHRNPVGDKIIMGMQSMIKRLVQMWIPPTLCEQSISTTTAQTYENSTRSCTMMLHYIMQSRLSKSLVFDTEAEHRSTQSRPTCQHNTKSSCTYTHHKWQGTKQTATEQDQTMRPRKP